MTAGAVAGVLVALGAVLALMLGTLRVLKRFAPAAVGGRARLPLEVVQRLSLGPKQGVAVVRVGGRVLVLGTGEGGVQPLAELDGADLAGVLAPAAPAAAAAPQAVRAGAAGVRFGETLRAALTQATRVAGVLLLVAVAGRAGGAQVTARTPARPAAAPPTATPPATPSALPASTQNALVQSALAQAALRQVAVQQVTRAAPARLGAGAPRGPNGTGAAVPGVPAAPSPAPPTLPPPAAGFAARPPSGTAPPPPTSVVTTDTMVAKLAPTMDVRVGGGAGAAQGLRLSGTVGVVVMLGLLTLLPSLVLMMTGFTRILVVLQFLKQALGTQTAPPNQLVAGLALLLTGFVMAPTVAEINRTALQPWLGGQIQQVEMLERGAKPLRAFMLRQTRERDLETFLDLSRARQDAAGGDTAAAAPRTPDDVPLVVLTSAFVTSELRTAFQLGFALFLPFIVIDVVVSAVLTSMGMMMLPPAMVSLPFKLLLFVLVDGWTLVVQSLVQSFR